MKTLDDIMELVTQYGACLCLTDLERIQIALQEWQDEITRPKAIPENIKSLDEIMEMFEYTAGYAPFEKRAAIQELYDTIDALSKKNRELKERIAVLEKHKEQEL